MIEPLYALRDVDVPVGARTRVRARIEEQLAREALPKRHVTRYALASAALAAVIAFVAWPRPTASRDVVVPAGTQMDFAVASGHSLVHGPAQVELDASGLSLASGRVDAQGKLRVRGPSCDVMVDGTAEVSVTDAKLTVRVFAGSVEIVPPVVTCERIDLTPPAVSPTKATPPTAPPSTTPTITASTSPPDESPAPAAASSSAAANGHPDSTSPRAAVDVHPDPSSPRAAPVARADASSAVTHGAPVARADAARGRTGAVPPSTHVAPAMPPGAHAAPAVPQLAHVGPTAPPIARIEPAAPPLPRADSAPTIAPPSGAPPARVTTASPGAPGSATSAAPQSAQSVAHASTPAVPATSLAAEELAAALAEYRTAKSLESSDPDAAVRAWQAWRAHRSNTPLAHGADLRLLALLHTLHRDGEAAALAREFLQRYPHSPRRGDVERLLGGAR